MEKVINYPALRRNGSLAWGNNPDKIIIHNTAEYGSPEKLNGSMINSSFTMCGYNYYIRLNGEINAMRPDNAIGGNCFGQNSISIGIGFEGDFETKEAGMSAEQFDAGVWLCQHLINQNKNIKEVQPHNKYFNTACPGSRFPFNQMHASIYGETVLIETDKSKQMVDSPEYKLNNSGPEVKLIQQKLVQLGYDIGGVDSFFGGLTFEAVKQFQASKGLTSDGIVGSKTMIVLTVEAAKVQATIDSNKTVADQGVQLSIVKDLQTKLNLLMHIRLKVDGDCGPITNNAITEFEKMMGVVIGDSHISLANSIISDILLYPEIRLGSNSVYAVRYIQWRLGLVIDGDFGPVTDSTVRTFQKNHGLVVDGVVGTKSWSILFKW